VAFRAAEPLVAVGHDADPDAGTLVAGRRLRYAEKWGCSSRQMAASVLRARCQQAGIRIRNNSELSSGQTARARQITKIMFARALLMAIEPHHVAIQLPLPRLIARGLGGISVFA
jgi:hypothetical protein